MTLWRDFSFSAAYMGFLASFIGISSSFAIVLSGLKAVGADQNQMAQGLLFSSLIMGGLCLYWGFRFRLPLFAAWSLPGAALFSTMTPPHGGFQEIVGALILCAIMLLLTGLIRPLGRLVERIPSQVASAMLAGILLKICVVPAVAIGEMPLFILPIFIAWLFGFFFYKMLAAPFALVAFIAVFMIGVELPENSMASLSTSLFPELTPIMPIFSLSSMLSIALPLYLVTMASQNIPGIAVMKLFQIPASSSPLIRDTGLLSLLAAPFGSYPANLSAIVSSMCSGEDTHHDLNRRYWASLTCGFGYIIMGLAAGLLTTLLSLAPELLIASLAGLVLIPVVMRALVGAFQEDKLRDVALITFIITTSNMNLWGISGAFWGLVVGIILTLIKAHFSKTA